MARVINYSPHKGLSVPVTVAVTAIAVSIIVFITAAWAVGAYPFRPDYFTTLPTSVGGKSLDPSYYYTPCVVVGNGLGECLPSGKIKKDFTKYFDSPIIRSP